MSNQDCEVVVQTTFETPEALMNAIGSSVQRGRLCLPMRIELEEPFHIVLATRDGEGIVRGRVEVIARNPDSTTWLRFQSADVVDEADSVNHVLSAVHVTYPEALAAKFGFAQGSTKIAVLGDQIIAEVKPAAEVPDPTPVSFDDPTSIGPRILPPRRTR